MDIEIKIDEKYNNPKIVIFTNKLTDEISNIYDELSNIDKKVLKAYQNEKMHILNQYEIESIYSENGKVYVRCNDNLYTVKNRLYELESLLDDTMFIRISNSEIINFNKVKNIDSKITGTLILNFKSGNKSYSSRRYIPKIKKFLEI